MKAKSEALSEVQSEIIMHVTVEVLSLASLGRDKQLLVRFFYFASLQRHTLPWKCHVATFRLERVTSGKDDDHFLPPSEKSSYYR